jgi:hypothetical protein
MDTVVVEGDLAPSSSDCSPLDYFAWGVFELRVIAKPHNKTKNLILNIRGVMVSLSPGTSWQKPTRVQVPDWGCRRCWWQFYWLILSTFLCQPVFTSMKSVFSCAVSFKKNKIKISDLLLPPWRKVGFKTRRKYGSLRTLIHYNWYRYAVPNHKVPCHVPVFPNYKVPNKLLLNLKKHWKHMNLAFFRNFVKLGTL